tara:strand:- start:131 stop:370 length:240 start_codon:yes stop_codon:yes gene_type:complete
MDDNLIDIVGWLGFILIIIGYFFNARKKIYCFYIWGIGNLVYLFYGFIINAFPMMAMSAFILIMNVYGYMSWVKDFKKS